MKIISGGQTGVDRAGLDAAIALGISYGGAVPKGRLTETGSLDNKYKGMEELNSKDYTVRTEKNVMDSDATLVFTMGQTGVGTALTIELAEKYNKDFLHIDLKTIDIKQAITDIRNWLKKVNPDVLNIAGSRESGAKGIYNKVYHMLLEVLNPEQ